MASRIQSSKIGLCLIENLATFYKGTVDQKITHRPGWNLVREEILNIEPSNLLTCKQLRP